MANDLTLRGLKQAADLLGQADALLITAGAGLGVDSGLPDFRSPQGFWRAYPALKARGLGFEQIAQPSWFLEEPETAWAFYGHRQQLYREAQPHAGFGILLDWGRGLPGEYFAATSNVDGQFQAAGYAEDRLLEVHGSLHVLQCTTRCQQATWAAESLDLRIDLHTLRALGELPRCPHCGGVARPNVLMFDDASWIARRRDQQRARYQQWLATVRGRRVLIIEVGAGLAIPTIRRLGEDLVAQGAATLVRINPDASEADEGTIPIRMGALEALQRINELARPAIDRRAGQPAGARPRSKATATGPEQLPRPVPEREMEVLDFVEGAPGLVESPTWARVLPRHSDLRNTTFVDLTYGHVEPFNYLGITVEDEQAVLDCWRTRGFGRFPPVPSVGGHVAPGFLVTGQWIQLPGAVSAGRPGAGVLYICSDDRERVLTVGIGRRPMESAYLWRMLFEDADANRTPLDVPMAPWIARRLDRAASRHAAMLPALQEIGRVMAWTWLRWQTWLEQQGRH